MSTTWVQEGRSWWLHDADWRPDEERDSVRSLVDDTVTWLKSMLPEIPGGPESPESEVSVRAHTA